MGRWAVAAGLLAAGVVAPVESRDWFGPLEGLAPAEPVRAAAGTVVAGTPEDCSTVDPDPDDSSTTWTPADGADADDRECVLTAEAVCPTGYVKPTTEGTPFYLCYPQSCAGTVFNVDQIGEYWVPEDGVDTSGVDQCRVFKLTECRAGIGPTHEGRCRYVKRRSWTCPDDTYSKYSRFNACYQDRPASAPGTPPPCDTAAGAPTLALVSCDDYAGDDYDNSQDCADISSLHLADRSGGAAAAYWCEFDASDLNIDCHRNPLPSGADCTAQTGVCLKRASTIRGQTLRALGGCYAIVRNIECADHQADYADKVGTGVDMEALAGTIRAAGCEPCRVMPFESLDPAECPDIALTNQPATIDLNNSSERIQAGISPEQRVAFQNKEDVGPGGSDLRATDTSCQELPPGRLTWSTPSFTGLAMVNTRVRLEIQWDFANASRAPARSSRGLGQCFLKPHFLLGRPGFYFSVEVEPLWPADDPTDSNDTGDRDLIESLFGQDALSWWGALSTAEKTGRTAAFYSTSAETVEVPCSREDPVWCIWEPQQAGYYSLTATGALNMSLLQGIYKNSGYTGSVPDDWHSQLTLATLSECRRTTPPPSTCQFSASGAGGRGVYIDGEPVGIRVHEVRVVSRTPSG